MFTTHSLQTETLGDLLKKNRQSSGWQLKDVERKIKVSEVYLQALEENDYYKLPSPTYGRGFLERYADFLGLDSKQIIERYRRESQFFETKEKILKQKGLSQAPLPGFRNYSHGRIRSALFGRINFDLQKIGLIVIVAVFLLYLVWAVGQAIFPPRIIIIAPADNFETEDKTIRIRGRVKGEAVVKINNQTISKLEKGFFEETIDLAPGVNLIKISSKKKHSPETVVWRRIIVKE